MRDESGLVTLAGGKLTTFRLMAQDALALAAPHAGKSFAKDDAPLFTPAKRLNPTGARPCASASPRATARMRPSGVKGRRDDDLHPIPGTETLWLELAIAARFEAVQHLDDLLLRRTRLGILCRAAAWTICRASANSAPRIWRGTRCAGARAGPLPRPPSPRALPAAGARRHWGRITMQRSETRALTPGNRSMPERLHSMRR